MATATRKRGLPGFRSGLVTTISTTGGVISPDGAHILGSTGAAVYNLQAPWQYREQNSVKKFFVTNSTSTNTRQVVVNSTAEGCSTGVTIGNSGTTLTFTAAGQCVELFATSATRWEIGSNVGTVASS